MIANHNIQMPILSVVVTSHEQKEQLRRCVDSIIAMHIGYPYEIIISDDRSKDGTYELAMNYAEDVRDSKIVANGLVRIIAIQCNSDECNPGNNSDRCGFNKCNGFKVSAGKYFAFVDADDYFREGADVYYKQVCALEAHPECALAMSNYFYIDEEQQISDDKKNKLPRVLKDGEIIEATDFAENFYFHLNQAFMMRKTTVDPIVLYGKDFNDTVVTYHYLQYGSIVYADACDYVYVQYSTSITGDMMQTSYDSDIMWCLALHISSLIPRWRNAFLRTRYDSIRNVLRMAKADYMLQSKNYKALHSLNMWIYECFGHHLTRYDKLRLKICLWFQRKQKQHNLYGDLGCYIMWRLLK